MNRGAPALAHASAEEAAPDLGQLRSYTRLKLAVAGQLRILRENLNKAGYEQRERQCADLQVKLAEDRFTLAVLGQFKRGKSSLMNALIGRELLPTGVLPLTSAITVLRYGPQERLVVHRERLIFPEELPVTALTDYVTEKGNPANQKKVKAAYVELPLPYLRRGLEFVDTPGIGSAITANTATTYGFLPECDAVLFVTSVDTPLTSLELEFLKEIRQYVGRIFFVVNKTDLLGDRERREVLDYVANTIRGQMGKADVRIYPVSARQGLAAKALGDPRAYEQSGIKAFEEALAIFLAEEKSATFLASLVHKALNLVEEEAVATGPPPVCGSPGQTATDTRKSRGQDPIARLSSVRRKLRSLHEQILRLRVHPTRGEAAPLAISQVAWTQPPAELPMAERPATDLAEDLRMRGCAACQHLTQFLFDFFTTWQHTVATEEKAQTEFAAELGFCPLHTWQLLSVSSPRGASIAYPMLAERLAQNLQGLGQSPNDGEAVRALVRDARNCRVCRMLRQVEARYLERLAAFVRNAQGQAVYRRSQGVCLRHLGLLLPLASDDKTAQFLLSEAARRLEEASEDMQSYAMKADAIRRALHNADEEDAYARVIVHLVGARNLCAPWQEDQGIG